MRFFTRSAHKLDEVVRWAWRRSRFVPEQKQYRLAPPWVLKVGRKLCQDRSMAAHTAHDFVQVACHQELLKRKVDEAEAAVAFLQQAATVSGVKQKLCDARLELRLKVQCRFQISFTNIAPLWVRLVAKAIMDAALD